MNVSLLKSAKVNSIVILLSLCITAVFLLPINAQASGLVDQDYLDSIVDTNPNPVPHGATPEDEAYVQDLQEQAAIRQPTGMEMAILAAPTGAVWTPGEYEPCLGSLVAWEPGSYLPLLTEFVVGLTTDPNGSIAYVIVRDASQQATATTTLSGAGANMSRVEFIYYDLTTVWIRDYGPRYNYVDNIPSIIDHIYNRNRPADDGLPDWIDDQPVPYEHDELVHKMDLIHGGGNYHVFSNGDAFMSTLIVEENPSKTTPEITAEVESYCNVNLTIYQRLLSNVDATGHIDMWFMPVSDDTVIIGEFDSSHSNSQTVTETAVTDMENRGYTVYRVPSYNSNGESSSGGTHYTYTNAAVVNKRVYVPEYGHATDDATALDVYKQAYQVAPYGSSDYEIVQVDCAAIIPSAGAIHCVMKHIYAPINTAPVFLSTPETTTGVGSLYSYDVDAYAFPTATTYTLETYPSGMTINSSTGLIEWTPGSTGDFSVVVRATNSEGYDEQNYTLSVGVITVLLDDDFETDFGNWSNVTGDQADWVRNQGSTPSSSTGPDHDNTVGGGYYLFMESSDPLSTGDEIYLESPDIDAAAYNINLQFYYHMYGSAMGSLNVDIYDGTWNNSVWSISGQQHSSSADAYTLATVDLSSYTGTIKIRFRGVDSTSYTSDMAIDDITVIGTQAGAPDTNVPEPNIMTWNILPYATGTTSISMTATTATDDTTPVYYYFECTTNGDANSTWQLSETYEATGLDPSTEYTFRVKARDSSPAQNETAWSTAESATTNAPDTDPPTPNPATFDSAP
ncbi:agmatine deiminase family protein, partial [Planctomycetota bacterium]